MADNVNLNIGIGGDVLAADDIGGVKYQRVKPVHGPDGTATDTSSANPLPVYQQPFKPNYTTGQTVTPAAAAASVAINSADKQVCLTNTGLNDCYVRIHTDAMSATTADFLVLAGAQVIITKAVGDDVLSHISASGTTLHIITGEGN
jgi:hypothetical protein